MSPNEFLIAFNGFRALIGDEAPSPEQWARICEFHTEAVGFEVKAKWARDEQERQMQQMIQDQKASQAKIYAQLLYQPNSGQGQLSGGNYTTTATAINPLLFGSGTTIAKI